ncbi:MAG: hypothetical protein KIT54_05495 [Phycisphaeraceae bacterium]|nr:hypothetical protein [Phycisphaeraceae bacterium]
MGRIPIGDAALLAWARTHADRWSPATGQPPAIGLDNAQRARFRNKADAAEAAHSAMQAARQRALDATAAKDAAFAILRREASADLARIDAHAATTGDEATHARAGVRAPKTPGQRPAPPEPTDLRTRIDTDGSIRLSFKVTTGGGASYPVQRTTTDQGGVQTPYEFLGFAEKNKTYIDRAVPIGLKSVGYRVAARLNTGAVSPWSVAAVVPFGSLKPAAARGVGAGEGAAGSEGPAGGVGSVKKEGRVEAG